MRAKTIEEMIDALTAAWTHSRKEWEEILSKYGERMIEHYYDILWFGD